jgi:adenylate kinase family enzyme
MTAGDTSSELVLHRIRLLCRRRAAWLRRLWRAEVPDGTPRVITDGEIDSVLRGDDDPSAEASWITGDAGVRALAAELAAVEVALVADAGSRLAQLERTFSVGDDERDLLHACLAVAVDPALVRAYAYLADAAHRAYPTEPLVARLFSHGDRRPFVPESTLRRWGLITSTPVGPGEPDALAIDPCVREWLLGRSRLPEALVGIAKLVPPRASLPGWPVDELAEKIERALAGAARGIRLHLTGAPGAGRRTLAAAVASRLGLRLLAVDCDCVEDCAWPSVALAAMRHAFLDRCALAWVGDVLARRPIPASPAQFPVQFAITESTAPLRPADGIEEHAAEFPTLAVADRAVLWRALVPGAQAWPDDASLRLASAFRVGPGPIAEVAARAPLNAEAAFSLVREATRRTLGDLAERLECPFGWDDLVVPEALGRALRELVFEASDRLGFWEQPSARRLFPQGRGVLALLCGAPGTGKTMAAQVVAAALGLDLFRISLSSVVSKYVGETSQNLQRVLTRAERMDAVLLFDEADALFGKRTEIKDAHDRYANTDTGHLLQAIESYRGVAILATNKKGNIDPAFTRRLRRVLDFPRPDAADRLRLWQRLLGELAPARAEPLARELEELARTDCTGAQIKHALLTALFATRRERTSLAAPHLAHGLSCELAKDGRALSERHREGLLHAL